MRVLWVPHMPWAVMEGQREWHLIERLRTRGHEIHVLTWEAVREARALLRTFGSTVQRSGSVTLERAPRLPNPLGRLTGDYARGFAPNEWLFQHHVRRILRQDRFDVFVYGLSNKAIGLPPFDVDVPRVYDYLDLCVYPEVEQTYIRKSDLVLCTSTVLLERVRRMGARAAYLPNGVDRARIALGDGDAARRRWGLEGKTVVSLIGLTCSPTLFFVDAIAHAARQVPNVVFLAVGGAGWLPHEGLGQLRARCRELGVPLVTTGPVPNATIGGYFQATDVGLYPGDATPYFDAACPIKVLEYSAAGKPVVATDLAELRNLAFPNVYLAPPDPMAFGEAIVRALRERTAMPDLASFEWGYLADRFEETCASLVRERNPATKAFLGREPINAAADLS